MTQTGALSRKHETILGRANIISSYYYYHTLSLYYQTKVTNRRKATNRSVLIVNELVESLSLQNVAAVLLDSQNTALPGDGASGDEVVSRHHPYHYPRFLTRHDCVRHLKSRYGQIVG